MSHGRRRPETSEARYRCTLKGRYTTLKVRAKAKALAINLSLVEFAAVVSLPCHYCGASADPDSSTTHIDRIDNRKGYVRGNVLPCCGECNGIRSDKLTVEEMQVVIGALHGYRKIRKAA